MSYLQTYIPACEGFGWNGGPEFNTRIQTLLNGRERRNADWANGRHRYTLPFLNLGREEYRSVRQVFEVAMGMLHAFLYFDPLDNEASNELIGVSDGIRTEYQLSKLSTLDGVNYPRQVRALFVPNPDGSASTATPVVTVNGSPTAVTVDYERGLIFFSVAPANGAVIRWSGQFSVWVRFNQDWLPFSIDNRRAGDFALNGQVELIELPAPIEITSG